MPLSLERPRILIRSTRPMPPQALTFSLEDTLVLPAGETIASLHQASRPACRMGPIHSVTLTVLTGPHRGPSIQLSAGSTARIGRGCPSELRFRGDSGMSRQHLQINISADEVRLFDLGSRNGTFVNGTRTITVQLRHGDVITAGLSKIAIAIECV